MTAANPNNIPVGLSSMDQFNPKTHYTKRRQISLSLLPVIAITLPLVLFARPISPPTQAQVARRFLGEILRADYPAAYRRLAPEVRARLQLGAFSAAAQPLHRLGQQRGQAIELYKLGTRLGSRGGRGQWFYSFSFASDSLQKPPPVLLEVTFRDTTARQALGFRVRGR